MPPRYDSSPEALAPPARILVVDDEPANCRLVRAYLVSERFEVVVAEDGRGALAAVEAGVDLVILDIRMPGIDGLEVCRRIRQNPANARLPVIFLTAELNDPESELAGLEAGGDEYLHKPVQRAALLARVRSLLRLANAERDRLLMAQLAQAEKLAAIGQIAAGVAHEINNPLSFILSNLGTLGSYLSDVEQVVHAWRESPERGRQTEGELDFEAVLGDMAALVRETAEGGQRVRTIVQGLKSFSRSDDGPAEPMDLAEIAASTLLLTERELSSRATLVKTLDPAPLDAAPRNKLEQVMLNLLVNALHAVRKMDPKESRIRVSTGTRDGRAFLSVADNGCGISPEHKARIFEPFFTTKPVGEGTGIGLSFCANVVRKLGGDIAVESEPGKGATFTVEVPLQAEAHARCA